MVGDGSPSIPSRSKWGRQKGTGDNNRKKKGPELLDSF